MTRHLRKLILAAALALAPLPRAAHAAVGDPQVKTDHPWYPGELSCSTFERLFKTQAELYKRVTGRDVSTDEDKALASWYWRNLNFAHGEEGKCDLFGQGFDKTDWNREYWHGLFAHGFALCGTTHAQYTAEMEHLLGHCRARAVGVSGHNSFEVYLTGGAYGEGRWALLDHDIATVIFAPDGSRLLSIQEIVPQLKTLKDPNFKPERQRGWRVSSLHDDDAGGVYDSFRAAEYLSGYAGPPPMVHLRKNESLKRYLKPGLDDGKTFVFWGRNYKTGGIPGPERSRAWVNQPERMFNAKSNTGHHDGQVRFANAVHTHSPVFSDGSYKDSIVEETTEHVVFEFRTPYVIASTPANDKPWGIYDGGGRNGLIVTGSPVPVSVSTDHGRTWSPAASGDSIDLTDAVKGNNQYWLRFDSPDKLKAAKPVIRTVCQTNVATIPRLKGGRNTVTFAASNQSLVSAGPTAPLASAHVVDGALNSRTATLELQPPRGERATHLYAAAWVASGNPPAAASYQIEYSSDDGKSWKPIVKDWKIERRAPEPNDFWSQSFCYGDVELPNVAAPIRIRFSNNGGRTYRKVEAHLVYAVENPSPTEVTFAWKDRDGPKTASHTFPADGAWTFDTPEAIETLWVEYKAK